MEKNCKFCNKLFEAQRSTAEFCSPNCRVKWNNKKDKSPENFGLLIPIGPATNSDGSLKKPDKKFEYDAPRLNVNNDERKPYMNDAIKKKLGLP